MSFCLFVSLYIIEKNLELVESFLLVPLHHFLSWSRNRTCESLLSSKKIDGVSDLHLGTLKMMNSWTQDLFCWFCQNKLSMAAACEESHRTELCLFYELKIQRSKCSNNLLYLEEFLTFNKGHMLVETLMTILGN